MNNKTTREKINQAIKERSDLFMKEADYRPLTEQEREKVKGYFKKYRPEFMKDKEVDIF